MPTCHRSAFSRPSFAVSLAALATAIAALALARPAAAGMEEPPPPPIISLIVAATPAIHDVNLAAIAPVAQSTATANPAIDMPGFLADSREAGAFFELRKLTEAQFLAAMHEPGTVVLDARSREKFDELHIKGAINLSFPDITIESLHRVLPDKTTRVLIYCNNNFKNAEGPFPSKMAKASLNLSTFVALHTYGYKNVYELAPLIDLDKSILPFEGTAAKK